MRYVPDLIPKELRVLPDYFKGNVYSTSAKKKSAPLLFYLVALIFFLMGILTIKHPLLTILFGLMGFILLPQGHRWIEKKFRFSLTPKIKSVFGSVLFVTALPFVGHYQEVDKKEEYERKQRAEREEVARFAAEKKEKNRKDSLNYYLLLAETFEKKSRIDEALNNLSYASNFSPTEAERTEIQNAKNHVLATKTFSLVDQGKYKAAIPELTSLLSLDPGNSDLLYNRAICYNKTGRFQEAVNDLKPLLQSGNTNAGKLHDKINPIRKKIIGYETLCCDGTTSYARGRGACSHHGGVCNWNHPIYEEYRKYE